MKVLLRAGLPRIRFHDLRHTCVPSCSWPGENVKVVSERLGHRQRIRMTLEISSHVLPTMRQAAASKLDGLFGQMGVRGAAE